MTPNPFPTLQRIAPDRWEGDSRIVQVRYREGIYFTTVGSRQYTLRSPSHVQKLIDSVPAVTGTYKKVPNDGSVKWTPHGFGVETSVSFARNKPKSY